MKVDILVEQWTGYNQNVCSWECTMCSFRIFPDLDEGFVKETVMSHLRTHHNIEGEIEVGSKPRFTERKLPGRTIHLDNIAGIWWKSKEGDVMIDPREVTYMLKEQPK